MARKHGQQGKWVQKRQGIQPMALEHLDIYLVKNTRPYLTPSTKLHSSTSLPGPRHHTLPVMLHAGAGTGIAIRPGYHSGSSHR